MKKFTLIEKSRKDQKVAVITAVNEADHKDLLRAACCNSATGYVVDNGSSVKFANYAIDAVLRSVQAAGFVAA